MKISAAVIALFLLVLSAIPIFSQQIDSGLHGFWTLNTDKSDFGSRPKPKMGFVNWGEHGWSIAVVTADDRLYADAVGTNHGCTLIGVFQTSTGNS